MASNVPPAPATEEAIVDCVAFFYEEGKGDVTKTGNGERGTEVWERVVSGNLHKNPKWPVMYRSNRSFNMPPPGIPRAFDTFAVPGRREFDHQSLPEGGEFDSHALGVGNLNCTLDFM